MVLYTRVDHLGAMLNRNLDDLVSGEVGSNRRILSAFSDNICLVGLCSPLVSS